MAAAINHQDEGIAGVVVRFLLSVGADLQPETATDRRWPMTTCDEDEGHNDA